MTEQEQVIFNQMRDALESAWLWMENQADGQSKGGHATFDLMMLCEQRDIAASALAAAKEVQEQAPCQYCDGTGDVHTPTGEWRAQCDCNDAQTHAYAEGRADQAIVTLQSQMDAAVAWGEGYAAGVNDERISESNIGIAGFGAKVNPARENPYRSAHPQASEPAGWIPNTEKPMTPDRARYFMERFKKEEKLLGPNEQAAVDYVLEMLAAAPEATP